MEKNRQMAFCLKALSEKKSGRLLIFTGARQVGKTTLVRRQLDAYAYISLDDVVTAPAYAALTSAQWHTLYPKAVLDEVQKQPSLVQSIKAVYDTFPDTRYALLGSSQILLMERVRESLAGRCHIIDLYPLTLPEMQADGWDCPIRPSAWQRMLQGEQTEFLPDFRLHPNMPGILSAWNHLITFGGYPALVDGEMTDEERFVWLRDYVRTYLERDVRDLTRMRDLEPYIILQRLLAAQTAQTVVASNLAADAGVTGKTAKQYMQYMEMSYQILSLPAWCNNTTKRLVKSPKIHFMDYGVLQAVLNKRGGMTGSEFESFIVTELYKQARNVESPADFWHLRTPDGMEVDLLVGTPNGYYAFEIKQSSHVTQTDARHLKKVAALLDRPLLHAFVLSNDPVTRPLTPDITAVSAPMFLG